MAILTLDPDATVEFSFPGDRGEDQTIFLLGVLDTFTLSHAGRLSSVTQDGVAHRDNLLLLTEIVAFGLRGWRNLKSAAGVDVQFEVENATVPLAGQRQVVPLRLLRLFSVDQITKLAIEIQNISKIGEDQEKN